MRSILLAYKTSCPLVGLFRNPRKDWMSSLLVIPSLLCALRCFAVQRTTPTSLYAPCCSFDLRVCRKLSHTDVNGQQSFQIVGASRFCNCESLKLNVTFPRNGWTYAERITCRFRWVRQIKRWIHLTTRRSAHSSLLLAY